jgi:hypothetical protein
VCILLDFCDRLYVGIDYCMCVCVFMLKSCDFARTELCVMQRISNSLPKWICL